MPNQILDFVLKDNDPNRFRLEIHAGTAFCGYYSLLISHLSSFFPGSISRTARELEVDMSIII